jgi:amino acid transporter
MKKLFRKKSVSKILEDVKSGYADGEGHEMNKVLGVRDITFFGMAAIIGAGIFSTVGSACADGGPAIIFLFLAIAVACGFSALCYAEMASRIPVSGSAYTYTYATFGELIAWIIGWDLIMEYAIGNVTVAISWSGNLTTFLEQIGIHIPGYLSHGYLEVKKVAAEFVAATASGGEVTAYMSQMNSIWENAPSIGSMPMILNLPAFLITVLITALVYIGIKESRSVANGMVVFKVLVVILIIILGFFYVRPENWSPFAPNGASGVLKGVAAVFFAYIGFDALATVAEECKDPQRDLPKGMINSLIIATVLYILIALALTGMVKYSELNNEAFLANAFLSRGIDWIGGIIAFSALIATASVMLVFQIGQPRIWMSMSRDGLLPKKFSKIHKKYKTPSFATIITGILVGVPSLFMDADSVTDMCSIGTLFAFALVCGGIVIMHYRKDEEKPKFKVPYISAQYFLPLLTVGVLIWLFVSKDTTDSYAYGLFYSQENLLSQVPTWIFYISLVVLAVLSFMKKLSLIPMLGLLFCLYFLSTLGATNWFRFLIWLGIGVVIYFLYSERNSKLNQPK